MGPPQMNTTFGTPALESLRTMGPLPEEPPVLESPPTMGPPPDEYKILSPSFSYTSSQQWLFEVLMQAINKTGFFDIGMSTFLDIEDLEYRGLRARGMQRMYATRLRKPQGVNKMRITRRSKIGGSGYHNPPPQPFSDSFSL